LEGQSTQLGKINEVDFKQRHPDFLKLNPFFGWLNPDTMKNTFEHTNQYAGLPNLKGAFKSQNPALNVA
jgi:hypothetical protein